MNWRNKWVIGTGAVGAVVVLAVAWVLISPLFIDERVEEAFPGVPTPAALGSMSAEKKARIADDVQIADDVLAAATKMPDHPMTEAMPAKPAGPELLRNGQFADADAVHKGSGAAAIYRLADGTYVLRLADFKVTNGPDLRVILVRHADPKGSSDVGDDYVDLGALKGNIGNQNYPLPANTEVAAYGSVAIWCRAFGVLFSAAPLRAAV